MTPEDDASSRLLGTILAGRYRIVEKLGEGAMGAVYLGEHLKIGRRDAIKVLRQALAQDAEAIARFTRGARHVSTIRHPNVCAIYDFSDTDEGFQFLAMEYVAGETLKDTLDREHRLPLDRALNIARQVAGALHAAHEAGIVHRDLKPGNIMLVSGRDGRDDVKVVDFDIAKGPETGGEEVTRLGFVVGTPEYMSPEQLMGEPLDGRSDVYSLALVLFRMITGRLPFGGETTQDLMVQRLTHPPLKLHEADPASPVPEPVQALLDAGLERRASDRIASAALFERAVVALLDESAAPIPPSPRQPARAPVDAAVREVPPTRVAPSAAATPTPVADSSRMSAPGRRLPIRALAGSAVAIAMVIAATALLRDRGNAGPVPAAATDATATAGEAAPPPSDSERGTPTQPSRPAGTAPLSQQREPSPTLQTTPDPAAATVRDSPVTEPPAPAGPRIAPEQASDVLFQQLDLLTASQSGTTIDAVIDTASAVWRMRALPPRDRALAAYLLGSAYDARRDWLRCARWLDSALVLNPEGAGFGALRDKCRELSR